MKRAPLSSSCLKSIGYDDATKTLEVEFLDGRVYKYYSVPISEYRALMAAPSRGRYYSRYIKDAGYVYEQVP